ncbi:MAG TPA: DHHA1 domain-containing protein [archaeon]|nr:DHHA1 domain-containing protein [archaeon]
MEEGKILLARFKKFCSALSAGDNIAIVHHNDGDGITSAAITSKAVLRLTGKKPVFVSGLNYRDSEKESRAVEKLLSYNANKLIILDLSLGYYAEKTREVSFLDSVLIIDHHEFDSIPSSENVLFLHPKFFSKMQPSAYNASKFCFDLFNKILPLKETDWIAAIGIIADNSKKNWLPFLKKTAKRNKLSLAGLERLEKIVSAFCVMKKKKTKEIFSVLFEAENPRDLERKDLLAVLADFEAEIKKVSRQALESLETVPELGLLIYSIKADFPAIKSQIINDFSNKMPDKTIIIFEVFGKKISFSARRQDGKIQLNRVLQKAIEGIPDSNAGGHIPAAAGGIPKEYFNMFREQLISALKEANKKK